MQRNKPKQPRLNHRKDCQNHPLLRPTMWLFILTASCVSSFTFAYAASSTGSRIHRLQSTIHRRNDIKTTGNFLTSSSTSFLGKAAAGRLAHSLASWTKLLRGGSTLAAHLDATHTESQPTSISNAVIRNNLNNVSNAINVTAIDLASTSISDILSLFQLPTDHSTAGLATTVVQTLLTQYGTNTLVQPPGKSLWKLIAEQFEEGLVQILVGVVIVSGIFSFMEYRDEGMEGSLLKAFVEPLVITTILGKTKRTNLDSVL